MTDGLETGQQYSHIRFGRVTLVHVGDTVVAYDVHEDSTEPRYEYRGTFERDAELVDETIVTDGGTSSDDTEQIWGCSVCKTPCEIDWLRCPNCGHTAFEKYYVETHAGQ